MFSCTAESQYPLDVDVGRFEIFRRKSNCVSCLIWEKLEMNPIILVLDTVVLNMFIKLYISLFFWHVVGQMINQQINQQ